MAVLVTGATGFVGTWLVRELIRQNEEVRILHRPSSDLSDFKDLQLGSRLVSCIGDVTDAESVKNAVHGVETVFHLAGVVGYSPSMRKTMDLVNVQGTQNVIDGIKANSNKAQLMYMSSVVAVGASKTGEVLNEDSAYTLGPLNLGYFETKREAEIRVVDACKRGQLRAVCLNPSTIYGAGDAKKGSRRTQLKVARGKFRFYTSGGVSVVSVHDVVAALLSAREKGRNGERYILSGENLTIRDLFFRIADLGGSKRPDIHLPNAVVHLIGQVGDLMRKFGKEASLSRENAWTSTMFHWFDHQKAKSELGFNPRPSQAALKESVDWIIQNGIQP
jgi:dihydroflavonol-4-reductase